MKTLEGRMVVAGILILFMLASGVWLSRTGKPYNNAIFSVHKILALLAIVFSVIAFIHLLRGVELSTLLTLLTVGTGLFFLLGFVSGALLSFEATSFKWVLTLHKVTPYLIVASTAVTVYLLYSNR